MWCLVCVVAGGCNAMLIYTAPEVYPTGAFLHVREFFFLASSFLTHMLVHKLSESKD